MRSKFKSASIGLVGAGFGGTITALYYLSIVNPLYDAEELVASFTAVGMAAIVAGAVAGAVFFVACYRFS